MAFSIVSSLRMHATSASFCGFPLATQHRPPLRAAALHEASTTHGARLPTEGGHADELRDRAAGELPEFRQLGHQRVRHDRADAGDALQQIIALAPGRRPPHQRGEIAIDAAELALEVTDVLLQAVAHHRAAGEDLPEAIALSTQAPLPRPPAKPRSAGSRRTARSRPGGTACALTCATPR